MTAGQPVKPRTQKVKPPQQVDTLRRRYSSLAKRARELGLQPNGEDAGGPEPGEERPAMPLSRQPAEV